MFKRTMNIIAIMIFASILSIFLKFILPSLVDLFTNEFLSFIFRQIYIILIISTWFAILFRGDNSYEKLPWLLFLLIAPEIALIAYLSFARPYKKSKRYQNRPLMHDKNYISYDSKTDFSSNEYFGIDDEVNEIYKFTHNISGHKVFANDSKTTILNNGEETFSTLISKLKSAEKYIFMEYYILKTDLIGKEVLDILKEKAKEGLEVKLIFDYFGGKGDRAYLKELEEAGVEIAVFDKIHFPILNTKINYRLHRKITIIDGKYGFTGGLNLGDEYIHRSKKFGFWRDTHIMLEGAAVDSLLTILLKDYYYITGNMITDEKYFNKEEVFQEGYVQCIQSGPDSIIPIISQSYIKMINQAKKSVKIVTPYVSPSKELASAIKVAALSGIKVQLIIPGLADKKVVYAITKSFFETFLESGVEIYLYDNTFVHSKILVIDDKIASIGTFNIDNRSEIINFENTCIIANSSVNDLVDYFNEDLKKCTRYTKEDYENERIIMKILYAAVNLFAPLA